MQQRVYTQKPDWINAHLSRLYEALWRMEMVAFSNRLPRRIPLVHLQCSFQPLQNHFFVTSGIHRKEELPWLNVHQTRANTDPRVLRPILSHLVNISSLLANPGDLSRIS